MTPTTQRCPTTDFAGPFGVEMVAAAAYEHVDCVPLPSPESKWCLAIGFNDRLPASHPLRKAIPDETALYWAEHPLAESRTWCWIIGEMVAGARGELVFPDSFDVGAVVTMTQAAAERKRQKREHLLAFDEQAKAITAKFYASMKGQPQ